MNAVGASASQYACRDQQSRSPLAVAVRKGRARRLRKVVDVEVPVSVKAQFVLCAAVDADPALYLCSPPPTSGPGEPAAASGGPCSDLATLAASASASALSLRPERNGET